MQSVESQAGLQVVSFEHEQPDAIKVDWWITSLCNLACDFCYGPEPTRDPVELREKIALQLAASDAETITFCGGEPLVLGEELFRYARLFKAAGKRVVLNTNGELLESAIERFLLPGEKLPFDIVGISIEGYDQATHGLMRQRANGQPASLRETYIGSQIVKEYESTSLKVASVISGVSFSWIQQLVEFVRYEVDPDVMRLYHYSPNGPVNRGQNRHELSLDDFNKAVQIATGHAWRMPIFASDNESQGCLIVDPTGGVSVSTKAGYTALGNCIKEPIDEIWNRQQDSLRNHVQQNKRWIGSTALNVTSHCLQSGVQSAADFRTESRNLPLRHRTSELRNFARLITDYPETYEKLNKAYLNNVGGVLSPAEMRGRWYLACGDILRYDSIESELSDAGLVAANKAVDRFLFYANKAGIIEMQEDN